MKKKYFHTTIVLLVLFASNLHAQDTVSWGITDICFHPSDASSIFSIETIMD